MKYFSARVYILIDFQIYKVNTKQNIFHYKF
jgi:hypothetical protein